MYHMCHVSTGFTHALLPRLGSAVGRAADYTVRLQNLLIENCRNIQSFQLFCNFSEDFALLAQDMLHTEICTCDGNAMDYSRKYPHTPP